MNEAAIPPPPQADPAQPIRVIIIDDHELVRGGLREMLDPELDLDLVGEAGTLRDGIRRVAFDQPDVVVLDVGLPDGFGPDACQNILEVAPHASILILTGFADERALDAARRNGARGFILKRIDRDHILTAIRRVAAGETAFDEPPSSPRRTAQPLENLTEREYEILELISQGLTNRDIADALFLAEKTIKNYVSTVLAKLGVEHRAGAAALFARIDERTHMEPPASAWPRS